MRQLERRRVLDAAIANLAVSSLVSNEPADVIDSSADSPPVVFDCSSMDADEQNPPSNADAQTLNASHSSLPPNGGEPENPMGIDTNVRPVLVVALDQTASEGQLLDLSGIGTPPLGLFVDTDVEDTHTASIDWGDGSGLEDATIFAASGSGALGGSHVYAEDGLYQVTVTVTDDSGASDTKSFIVTVNNVRPVLVVATDQTVNEGQELDLSGLGAPPLGLFVDTGSEDTHIATVNWGDGTLTENATIFSSNGSGALGGLHTYVDDGIYTVTVSVFDDDGGSDTKAFNVTVNNVRPVLVVATDQLTSEGAQLDLSGLGAPPLGLFVDDGVADTHTATVNWGDGSPTENATVFAAAGSGALGGSHTYLDNGTYTVTVNVLDDDGGSDTKTFQVLVENVAPTATLSNNGPISVGSDASVFFSGQFDPGTLDTAAGFHYAYDFDNDGTFDVGDGTYAGSVTNDTQTVPAAFLGDGTTPHTVRARILDKDGGFTDYTTQIEFLGGPPTLVEIIGDTINEREFAMIFARIDDASASDVFEVDVDWKDGSTATITGLGATDASGTVGGTQYQWSAETRQLKLSHQYLDDNPTGTPSDTYNVTLVVRDSEENSAGPFTAPVTVNNVRPVLVVALDQTVNEGQELDLSGIGTPPLGLFVDDGIQDSHTATVDWGDGSEPQSATIFFAGGAGALGGTHTYLDDGVYTVTVTVTDDDGGSDMKLFTVTVNNVRPVLVVAQDLTANEGQLLDLSGLAGAAPLGLFVDPGVNDTHVATIDWGDGSAIENAAIFASDGSGALGGTHTYADDGVYTVIVTVTDDDEGSDVAEFRVTIHNVNPDFVPVAGGDPFEGDDVTPQGFTRIRVSFDDPGFDNPNNPLAPSPPSITDTRRESFTHLVDWSDGTIDAVHTYAEAGVYTVTVTVSGPGGVQMFSFPGFDSTLLPVLTLVSSQELYNPAVPLQNFTYTVNWGDGAVQTIPLSLKAPGVPVFGNGLTTVESLLRTSGDENTLTTGSFEIEHRYEGPPNPADPAADIPIRVTIVDDNLGSVTGMITVESPIPPPILPVPVGLIMGAELPRLELLPPAVTDVLPDQQTSTTFGFQTTETRVARSELTITSDVYLELEVISADGKVVSTHRISDEALLDLRAFFSTLPDNRYRIYLVRTDNNSRRFIMEVYVRGGRVIDPGDDSDGTRDRPPTSEETIQVDPVPLNVNPFLDRVPNRDPNDAAEPANEQQPNPQSGGQSILENVAAALGGQRSEASDQPTPDTPPAASFSRLRWIAPMAALGLVAASRRRTWSQELDAAFCNADDGAWRRLRRAARLGKRAAAPATMRQVTSH